MVNGHYEIPVMIVYADNIVDNMYNAKTYYLNTLLALTPHSSTR